MERERFCAWCGESMGVFEWSREDGPLSCGKRECNRYAREEREAQREEVVRRALEDAGFE